MDNFSIVSYSDYSKYRGTSDVGKISWSYAHGDLEDDLKHDIFYIYKPQDFGFILEKDSNIIESKPEYEGLHKFKHNGKDCTFFIWISPYYQITKTRGLAVYDDDKDSYNYAKKCYNNKVESL